MKTTTPTSLLTALLCCAVFAFAGCAWIAAHPNTVAAVETNLVKIGATIAQTSLNNGTINYAQAVPLGLNSITDVVAALNADKAAPVIANAVNTFSAWTIPAAQVNQIVAAYVDSNPETPAARKAFLIAAAGDLSTGIQSKAK